MNTHEIAQGYEKDWWGNCTNTFGEELKQVVYSRGMSLKFIEDNGIPYQIDLVGKTVLDIGGGPTSMLLKAKNGRRIVIDPCDYPEWVRQRYEAAGIEYVVMNGEDISEFKDIDEVWIYNVLQHTIDPQKIINNAKRIAKTIRVFEWVNAETNAMHPHRLTKENLDLWLEGDGKVDHLDGLNGCYGDAYYGTFIYE